MAQWKYYDAGIGNVGSYQASGHPWVTSSHVSKNTTDYVSLPFVSKAITIINTGSNDLKLHFLNNSNAKNNHFIYIKSTGSIPQGYRFPIKCREFYITEPNVAARGGGYHVIAELTRIDRNKMFALTGSGIDADSSS